MVFSGRTLSWFPVIRGPLPFVDEVFATHRSGQPLGPPGARLQKRSVWPARLKDYPKKVERSASRASRSAPREVTWFTGVFLFGLALTFGFTGYLLPWNELAYFATRVGAEIVSVIPWWVAFSCGSSGAART